MKKITSLTLIAFFVTQLWASDPRPPRSNQPEPNQQRKALFTVLVEGSSSNPIEIPNGKNEIELEYNCIVFGESPHVTPSTSLETRAS